MNVPREEWVWFGDAGHLIVGSDCRYHLATHIGPWWVSTVGKYLPDSVVREILAESRSITLQGMGDARLADWMDKAGYEKIGVGRTYETMVFRAGGDRCDTEDCGCGIPLPTEWTELDSDAYNDAGSAHRGHYAMCEKWAAIDEGEEPE